MTLCLVARLARGRWTALRVVFVASAHQGGEVAVGSKWRKFAGTILEFPAGLKSGSCEFRLSIFEEVQKKNRDSFALQEEAFCGFCGPRWGQTSWKWRIFLWRILRIIFTSSFESCEVARW